jgi:hypothetical protein
VITCSEATPSLTTFVTDQATRMEQVSAIVITSDCSGGEFTLTTIAQSAVVEAACAGTTVDQAGAKFPTGC